MAFTQQMRVTVQLVDEVGHKDSFQFFGSAQTTSTISGFITQLASTINLFSFMSRVRCTEAKAELFIDPQNCWAPHSFAGSDIQHVGVVHLGGPLGKPTPIPIDVPGVDTSYFTDGILTGHAADLTSLYNRLINGGTTHILNDRNGVDYTTRRDVTLTVHKLRGSSTRR